jgi:hypothetical protein
VRVGGCMGVRVEMGTGGAVGGMGVIEAVAEGVGRGVGVFPQPARSRRIRPIKARGSLLDIFTAERPCQKP